MAFTKKWLSAMNLDEEKIEQIVAAHREVVDALKEERDKFEAEANKVPVLEQKITDLEKDKTDLQKDKTDLQKKIDEFGDETETQKELARVKKDFDDYKADIAAKETVAKKKTMYSEELKKAGVSDKWIPKILRLADIDGLELSEDGKSFKNDKLADDIKTEYADYIVDESQRGRRQATPPQDNGGGDSGGEKSIAAMMAEAHKSAHYGEAKKGD